MGGKGSSGRAWLEGWEREKVRDSRLLGELVGVVGCGLSCGILTRRRVGIFLDHLREGERVEGRYEMMLRSR